MAQYTYLDTSDFLEIKTIDISNWEIEKIENVNHTSTLDLIQKFQPEIIFINGTRIISKKLLDQVSVPVLNIHTGITPKYCGVHGGY